jgi:hypothetical protein
MRNNLARLSAAATQSTDDREILSQIHRDLDETEVQLSWLRRGQRSLDERLEKIEQSLLFRIVRWPGARYAHIRNLMDRWFLRPDSRYEEWVAYERRSLLPGREECLICADGTIVPPTLAYLAELQIA